jgi:hypothetical protein
VERERAGKILEVLHPILDNAPACRHTNPPAVAMGPVEEGVPGQIYPQMTALVGIKEDGLEYEHTIESPHVQSIAVPDGSALSTPTGLYPLADRSPVLTTKLGKARSQRRERD